MNRFDYTPVFWVRVVVCIMAWMVGVLCFYMVDYWVGFGIFGVFCVALGVFLIRQSFYGEEIRLSSSGILLPEVCRVDKGLWIELKQLLWSGHLMPEIPYASIEGVCMEVGTTPVLFFEVLGGCSYRIHLDQFRGDDDVTRFLSLLEGYGVGV